MWALGPVPYPHFSHEWQPHDKTERVLELGLPIPLPVASTLPVLHVQDVLVTHKNPPDHPLSEDFRSLAIGAGLLHHAAEGSPRWYGEILRFGQLQHKGRLGVTAGANLENWPWPWPLTPSPSDQVEFWLWLSWRQVPYGQLWTPNVEYKLRGQKGWLLLVRVPEELATGWAPPQTPWQVWVGITRMENVLESTASTLTSQTRSCYTALKYQPWEKMWALQLQGGVKATTDCYTIRGESRCTQKSDHAALPFILAEFEIRPH